MQGCAHLMYCCRLEPSGSIPQAVADFDEAVMSHVRLSTSIEAFQSGTTARAIAPRNHAPFPAPFDDTDHTADRLRQRVLLDPTDIALEAVHLAQGCGLENVHETSYVQAGAVFQLHNHVGCSAVTGFSHHPDPKSLIDLACMAKQCIAL